MIDEAEEEGQVRGKEVKRRQPPPQSPRAYVKPKHN